jgi:hypothetical protein
MAYCTYIDVQLEIGAATGTATITDITNRIAVSDAEINDLLFLKDLIPPATSTYLNHASVYKTVAWIKRRQAHELSRPNSLSLGGDISFGASPEAEARTYDDKAAEAFQQYCTSTGIDDLPSDLDEVTRCDADIGEMRLDTTTDPVFYSDTYFTEG